MLSKIKSSIAAEQLAASLANQQHHQANNNNSDDQATASSSDNDDSATELLDNDTNNNNNTININNNQQAKKSQDELLDIVELSRKRRLSKDSADSLTSFIRWSFTHSDTSLIHQKLADSQNNNGSSNKSVSDEAENDLIIDDDHDDEHNEEQQDDEEKNEQEESAWPSAAARRGGSSPSVADENDNKHLPERLLRYHTRSLRSAESSNEQLNGASPRSDRQLAGDNGGALKRLRSAHAAAYSPESKLFASGGANGTLSAARKSSSSSYLGNVVDRLHQHQQQRRGQHHDRHQLSSPTSIAHQHHHHHQLRSHHQPHDDHQDQRGPANGNGGVSHNINQQQLMASDLSLQMQQFLPQQSSIEELCSSIGLDESNQFVLAAAIQRALADGMGAQALDSKSIASSNGSSTSASSGVLSNGSNLNDLCGQLNGSSTSSGANNTNTIHLIESYNRQQQQRQQQQQQQQQQRAGQNAYSTRASAAAAGLSQATGLSPAAAAMAAAAAAAAAANRHQHQHQHQQQSIAMNMSNRLQQQRHAQAAAALTALAGGAHPSAGLHLGASLGAAAAAAAAAATGQPNQMVEFRCDTCPSSFDDRHRLMQHQSIHLELKKDWFTETPVDEVMKIFNRRRGEFLCNICNLRFEATLDYDQHNHAVHGPRPYCCQFCGNGTRTFKCWRQYLNHLYDHRYIFSCTIDDCDFTVNRRDSLRFHIFRFHLNCQLPQNQHNRQTQAEQQHHQQLLKTTRAAHHNPHHQLMSLALNGPNQLDQSSKWANHHLEDDEDTENEMNVAD